MAASSPRVGEDARHIAYCTKCPDPWGLVLEIKFILLGCFVASALYVHYRGRVRHSFKRQVTDHSTFMAPINCLMYLFSKVPTTPYIDVGHFPALQVLQHNWQSIRDEGLALRESGHVKAAGEYNDIGFNSFFKTGWKRFYLKWYDDSHPSAETHCPRTVALLKDLPGIKAAMFAELPPGGRLVRHRDPFAGSLRYHLGLATPGLPGCYIDVDGQRYSWQDGEGVVFDETYIHYAENTTDQDRLILFCDLERPLRYRWASTINHWFGRYILSAATSPNAETDRTGGINRLFSHLYSIRLAAKRFKRSSRTNRRIYYAIKWLVIIAILAAILMP